MLAFIYSPSSVVCRHARLSLTAGCGALTFGYDGAFIGTTIARPSFKEAMGIDKMTKAQQTANTTNLTSTFTGSAFFGAVFAWPG